MRPYVLLMWLAPLPLNGCAGISQSLVTGATNTQSTENVAALLGDPRLQTAAHDLGKSLTTGLERGLADPTATAELQAAIDKFVTSLSRTISGEYQVTLSPVVQAELARTIDTVIRAALAHQQGTEQFVAGLTAALVTTLGTELDRSITEQIGPALQTVIERDIAPALSSAMRDEVGPALNILLARDVLPPITSTLDAQRVAIIADVRDVLRDGQDTANSWTVAFGVTTGFLLLLVGVAAWAWRSATRQAAEREAAVLLLAEQIKHLEGVNRGAAVQLTQRVKEVGDGRPEALYLSDLLRRRRDLKVQ